MGDGGLDGPTGTPGARDVGSRFGADCDLPGVEVVAGTCMIFVDPTAGPDREPHLAAHPTDPEVLLLTWSEDVGIYGSREYDRSVWSAVSRDGGATWTSAPMEVETSAGTGPAAATWITYDSVAAFGPDGTFYVLYGGADRRSEGNDAGPSRITVARSADGLAWTRSLVAEAWIPRWDAMSLAVAPDSGTLYAVAQTPVCAGRAACPTVSGVWLWTSEDRGSTWSPPIPVHLAGASGPPQFWPRVVAGDAGLVVVTTVSAVDPGAWARISRDGGSNFEPAIRLVDDRPGEAGFLLGGPPALSTSGDSTEIVFFVSGREVALIRSSDAGRRWTEAARTPAPVGLDPFWTVTAARGSDVAYGLALSIGFDEPAWSLTALRAAAAGRPEVLEIVPPTLASWSGGEYGGLAITADGDVWAAWPDRREAESSRIALARLT